MEILRFLYFLFLTFFLFVNLSIIFWLILKIKIKYFFLGCHCNMPLYNKELFLLNSVLH